MLRRKGEFCLAYTTSHADSLTVLNRFGWVNASYVVGLEVLDEPMRRRLGALASWDEYRYNKVPLHRASSSLVPNGGKREKMVAVAVPATDGGDEYDVRSVTRRAAGDWKAEGVFP